MSTYLADSIRGVARCPTADALDQLGAIAARVERLERAMNEIVSNAYSEANAVARAAGPRI